MPEFSRILNAYHNHDDKYASSILSESVISINLQLIGEQVSQIQKGTRKVTKAMCPDYLPIASSNHTGIAGKTVLRHDQAFHGFPTLMMPQIILYMMSEPLPILTQDFC